jgi:hypothetical protein
MLALSLLLLLGINALQRRGAVSYRRAHAA